MYNYTFIHMYVLLVYWMGNCLWRFQDQKGCQACIYRCGYCHRRLYECNIRSGRTNFRCGHCVTRLPYIQRRTRESTPLERDHPPPTQWGCKWCHRVRCGHWKVIECRDRLPDYIWTDPNDV